MQGRLVCFFVSGIKSSVLGVCRGYCTSLRLLPMSRPTRFPFLVAFCIFAAGCGMTSARPASAQGMLERGAAVLEQARADVEVLASDSLKGRGYLYDGHTKAARYIQERFREAGLQPVGDSYYQPFILTVDVFPETPELSVNREALSPGADFLVYASSGSGEAEAIERVLQAGSGVVLPRRINAYGEAGSSVRDAVVVLEEVVPDSLRAMATGEMQGLLSVEARVEVAAELGAQAVIFLTDRLMFGGAFHNASIPVFQVKREAWPETVNQVSYRVRGEQDRGVQTQNVLGWLPGTAQPDSFIVLMAHYDHHGAHGEALYFPGANDNASGVALLLALADHFGANPLRYSILFAAFSGEELGLIGSHHFITHPPVDLARTVLLLNFDMVASGEAGVMAVGGVDYPDLFADLAEVNASLGSVPLGKRSNAPNSDHFLFLQRGIPGFFLYTNRGTQPYHHVDDRPETLEWDDFLHVYALSKAFLEQQAGDRSLEGP